MDELLYQMNPWWERYFSFQGIKREKYLSLLSSYTSIPDIIFLTGLRRIGKTTILKQHIFNLIQSGVNPKQIAYVSLDSYSFNNFSIQEILTNIRKINSLRIDDKIYFFLDEVTFKSDFRQELKNLYDLGNCKIFASASSASLLVDHKAFLTGRTRTILVDSLDFDEFLLFKNYIVNKSERYLLEKYFLEYMQLGGIPEYVLTNDPSYLSNLINNIIYKDIIAVNNLKKQELVKDLFILLCERVGKIISYNQLAKLLGTTKDTIKEYIGFFEQTYLFYLVHKKGKPNERLLDGKKIYCSDVGLRNHITGFRDKGSVYENLVFLKIKHEFPSYINVSGVEIDFCFKDTLLEAKFGVELNDKQKNLFDSLNYKHKFVARGVDFFIGKTQYSFL